MVDELPYKKHQRMLLHLLLCMKFSYLRGEPRIYYCQVSNTCPSLKRVCRSVHSGASELSSCGILGMGTFSLSCLARQGLEKYKTADLEAWSWSNLSIVQQQGCQPVGCYKAYCHGFCAYLSLINWANVPLQAVVCQGLHLACSCCTSEGLFPAKANASILQTFLFLLSSMRWNMLYAILRSKPALILHSCQFGRLFSFVTVPLNLSVWIQRFSIRGETLPQHLRVFASSSWTPREVERDWSRCAQPGSREGASS